MSPSSVINTRILFRKISLSNRSNQIRKSDRYKFRKCLTNNNPIYLCIIKKLHLQMKGAHYIPVFNAQSSV